MQILLFPVKMFNHYRQIVLSVISTLAIIFTLNNRNQPYSMNIRIV